MGNCIIVYNTNCCEEDVQHCLLTHEGKAVADIEELIRTGKANHDTITLYRNCNYTSFSVKLEPTVEVVDIQMDSSEKKKFNDTEQWLKEQDEKDGLST